MHNRAFEITPHWDSKARCFFLLNSSACSACLRHLCIRATSRFHAGISASPIRIASFRDARGHCLLRRGYCWRCGDVPAVPSPCFEHSAGQLPVKVLFGYLVPPRGRVVLSVSVRGFECGRKRLFCLVENSVVLGLLALRSCLAGFNSGCTPRAQASLVDLISGYSGQRFFADRGAETPARRAGICSGG